MALFIYVLLDLFLSLYVVVMSLYVVFPFFYFVSYVCIALLIRVVRSLWCDVVIC